MENINAVLIEDGLSQDERLIRLNKIAIHQMVVLEEQNQKILKYNGVWCLRLAGNDDAE